MIVGAQRAPLDNAGNPLAGRAIAIAIAFASLDAPYKYITLMPIYLRGHLVAYTFASLNLYPIIPS